MLDIVQSFPLLSYCIVSLIYISPICNVSREIHYSEEIIKIRNSLFFSLHRGNGSRYVLDPLLLSCKMGIYY